MILKGVLPNELKHCLENNQKHYDNNLMFNRFDQSYRHKRNTEGLKAVDMSEEVIIAKDHGKVVLVNINGLYDNPLIDGQTYHCIKNVDGYNMIVYNERGEIFAERNRLKTPILVLDFLKHNREINAVQFTLKVADSRGVGARRSWSGRRTVSACWHAHRDVMIDIFELNPNANLKTAMAHYKNKESFYDLYPGTGGKNIGSQFQPAYAEDLCDC
jgi:hypothetical protein